MADTRRRTPSGELKQPKFVRFHPEDGGEGCDEIFWEDPLAFTPRRGRNGYVDSWGIYSHNKDGIRDVDGMLIIQRKMITQFIYDNKNGMKQPEIQFIDALIHKKIAQLKGLDIGAHLKSDYTLYVSLPHIEHPTDPGAGRYRRRVRVSGGLPLSVFADKILTPLWGWVRNLHVHIFHDFTDGALFGPKRCNAVDMMHLDMAGYAYIPEEDYCIAHILREPGQVMGYHYDLGDNWWVDIKLEEITPPSESTGAVVVLDGAGGVPADGSGTGTFSWAHYLREARTSPAAKRKAVSALFGATNYAGQRPPADPTAYDFDAFDLEETRARVRAALESKASMSGASKRVVVEFPDMGEQVVEEAELEKMIRLGLYDRSEIKLKRGTTLVQTPVAASGAGGPAYWSEGVSVGRRDNPGNTACSWCGSPHGLKACSQCKQWYYCGKECQKAHWTNGHKKECAVAKK